jgi:hypothetical protein
MAHTAMLTTTGIAIGTTIKTGIGRFDKFGDGKLEYWFGYYF